jgi:hypothetical protein
LQAISGLEANEAGRRDRLLAADPLPGARQTGCAGGSSD